MTFTPDPDRAESPARALFYDSWPTMFPDRDADRDAWVDRCRNEGDELADRDES